MQNYNKTYEKNKLDLCRRPSGREEAGKPATGSSEFLGDVVDKYENPHLGWESLQVKKLLQNELVPFVSGLAHWTTFITLTFKEEKTPDVANSLFKWFIRVNNAHAFGERYTRKVGHSYFSYAVGLENQKRDVPHFHLLVDKPLDFSFIHQSWGQRCGFVWIDTAFTNTEKVVNYVCKYVLKGGQVDLYKAKGDYKPITLPSWWLDTSLPLSRVTQGLLFSPCPTCSEE